MITQTRQVRSTTAMVSGSVLLVLAALAPAGVLHLTGSLAAGVVCLGIALLCGVITFTLMTAHKLTYGPGGVHVVADDGMHTLAWHSIEKFDLDKWWASDKEFVRGMVIRLKDGEGVKVDWIKGR